MTPNDFTNRMSQLEGLIRALQGDRDELRVQCKHEVGYIDGSDEEAQGLLFYYACDICGGELELEEMVSDEEATSVARMVRRLYYG